MRIQISDGFGSLCPTLFCVFLHFHTSQKSAVFGWLVLKRWLLWKSMRSTECHFMYNFNLKYVWIALISRWKSNDCVDLTTQGPLQSTLGAFQLHLRRRGSKKTRPWLEIIFIPRARRYSRHKLSHSKKVGIYCSVIKGTTPPTAVVPHNEYFCCIDPHEGRDQAETRRYKTLFFALVELGCVCATGHHIYSNSRKIVLKPPRAERWLYFNF